MRMLKYVVPQDLNPFKNKEIASYAGHGVHEMVTPPNTFVCFHIPETTYARIHGRLSALEIWN